VPFIPAHRSARKNRRGRGRWPHTFIRVAVALFA
jgi:hypothetical protein